MFINIIIMFIHIKVMLYYTINIFIIILVLLYNTVAVSYYIFLKLYPIFRMVMLITKRIFNKGYSIY